MAPIRKKEIPNHLVCVKEDVALDGWKEQAEIRQQDICNLVINFDWDSFKSNEEKYLEEKVKCILFGPSNNDIDISTSKLLKNICEKINGEGCNRESSDDGTCMTYIYVFWSSNGSDLQGWPVFKVPKSKVNLDAFFIDINARVYKNWDDFLKNNKFPASEYCYPKEGKYFTDEEGKVMIEFAFSPANKLSNKVIHCLDNANAGLALGTTIVTAASLIVPVASPVLQASLWLSRGIIAYSTVRSGSTLYDRGIHKQNVGFNDSESRNCWLAIGASTVGAVSSSANSVTSKMAQSGRVLGRLGCTTVTALTFGNIALNGLGILNWLHGLIERYHKKQLSSLDILQFSASLLLFTHAVVNVKTAKAIIENTQENVIQEFENSLRSNRHRRMFRKVARNTRGDGNMLEGNAKVIRTLQYINNVDDFFSALVRMDKQFRPTASKVTLTEGGLIQVNEHLSIDPTQLLAASIEDRMLLLEATKKYQNSNIGEIEFRNMAETILGDIPSAPFHTPKKLCFKELLGLVPSKTTPILCSDIKFSYPLLSAYERMELMSILKKFADSDHEHILQVASVLFKALNWTLGLQYVEVAYFVCGLIRNIANNAVIEKNNIDISYMITGEYCRAALQEFLQNPSKLVHIFNQIKMIFDTLSERNAFPTQFRNIGLFEIAQLSSVLLQMDKPLWIRIITFSEDIFHALRWTKLERIIKIVKDLCFYIVQSLQDLDKKSNNFIAKPSNVEIMWEEASQERAKVVCNSILDTLSEDANIRESLMEEIWKNNNLQSSDICKEQDTCLRFTKEQPLELNKHFWCGEQLALLSEEEILDICAQTLEIENQPLNCKIEYDGCDICINVDDKLVLIKCNIDEGKVSAFVDAAVSL